MKLDGRARREQMAEELGGDDVLLILAHRRARLDHKDLQVGIGGCEAACDHTADSTAYADSDRASLRLSQQGRARRCGRRTSGNDHVVLKALGHRGMRRWVSGGVDGV